MNNQFDDPYRQSTTQADRFAEARLAVQKAREALRNNNRSEARKLAEHAASLAPQMEDAWLVLAAIASPRASMEYLQRALKINPDSPRAHKGMQWAQQRLRESPEPENASENSAPPQGPGLTGLLPRAQSLRAQSPRAQASPNNNLEAGNKKTKRSRLYPVLLFGIGLLICIIVVWSVTASPVVASLANNNEPTPTHPAAWVQAQIAKPTHTPASQFAQTLIEPTSAPATAPLDLGNILPTALPTDLPALAPSEPPAVSPTELAASLPEDNSTPTPEAAYSGSLSLEYVADTPTAEIPTAAPASAPQTNYVSTGGERWVDVDLSEQKVYAYEGDTIVNTFIVSTGKAETPTVTGKFRVYIKLRFTDMSGPGYYLPDVPYVMYFFEGYGLHGTYWHNNFGTPMSRGCVNLSIPDAAWLFGWASVGTVVNVHD